MDPGARNLLCWPWVASPTPAKPCLLTTPWKPFPLEVPVTVTNSPSLKQSTFKESPNDSSESKETSAIFLDAGAFAFLRWPRSAFDNRDSFWLSNAICIASYPSLSIVLIWVTTQGPASIIVQGIFFLPQKTLMSYLFFFQLIPPSLNNFYFNFYSTWQL